MAVRVGKIANIGADLTSNKDKLLAAIARSAEELTSGKGWPEGVLALMEDLGKITGVSRVWIFQTIELGEDYIIQDYPFEWADEVGHAQLNLPRFNMFRNEISTPAYRAMIESRKKGEWQSIVTSEISEDWVKRDMERQGILSMLTIPIMVEGQWWGTLGFDDCRREYVWSDVEIALLRTASYLISNAVIRDRLSAKIEQINILHQLTESNAWELDLRNGHFWCGSGRIGSVGDLRENIHLNTRGILRLIHPDDIRPLLESFRSYLQIPSVTTFRMDLRIAVDCGMFVWVEVIGCLTRDGDGKPIKFAGIAVEIVKRKAEEEILRSKVGRDALTGAGNRLMFDEKFARLASQADTFCMLLMDLDHFKLVNDQWGHAAGDAALRHFTDICFKTVRSTDTLFRIGGEEFAVLLPDTDRKSASRIGERIRLKLEQTPLDWGNGRIWLTVCIGCGEYFPARNIPKEAFVEQVDRALYNAKETGRNCLVCVLQE